MTNNDKQLKNLFEGLIKIYEEDSMNTDAMVNKAMGIMNKMPADARENGKQMFKQSLQNSKNGEEGLKQQAEIMVNKIGDKIPEDVKISAMDSVLLIFKNLRDSGFNPVTAFILANAAFGDMVFSAIVFRKPYTKEKLFQLIDDIKAHPIWFFFKMFIIGFLKGLTLFISTLGMGFVYGYFVMRIYAFIFLIKVISGTSQTYKDIEDKYSNPVTENENRMIESINKYFKNINFTRFLELQSM